MPATAVTRGLSGLTRAARWATRPARYATRRAARAYRDAVVKARWFVVAGWLLLTVVVSLFLPTAGGGGGADIGNLLPEDSPAAAVQDRSLELFDVPVLSQVSVVVHDPDGLSVLTQADVALWAATHTQAYLDGTVPPGRGQIVAAVPLPTSTPETAVTYLYVSNYTSLERTRDLAREYAAHFHNQSSVQTYVTGVVPAQVAQADYLEARLHLFEVATLVLIATVVGLTFRSVVAPFVVLLAAGLGYLVAIRSLGVLAASLGFALPDQLQPLIAALLIGVVTDYCVLFFAGLRQQLDRGLPRLEATRRAVRTNAPIIAVAGITVAAGTAALLAADFQLFQAFGPALSLTVVIGVLVSLTLVPALMAILGERLFGLGTLHTSRRPPSRRGNGWLLRIVVDRRGAAVAALLATGVLVLAAAPLLQMRLDLSFTSGLPADDPVSRGAAVLEDSGIRGVIAPTEVIIEGDAVIEQRPALERLQAAIEAQPGVAEVLGPAQNPLPEGYGVVFSPEGDAARFVVILDSDPLAAPAISDLRQLSDELDTLATQAGLEGAEVAVTGQTAIAGELAAITRENLRTTLTAVLLVELLILIVYLRALCAPLVLMACSALGVAAALGLSVLLFQVVLGDPGLAFYVPFATAVLLLALGSDYNVFAVGSIWEAAARHPLSKAIMLAMPSTSRAISAAGLILAATFGMVAIIPLQTFRQVAFTMAAGLLIDTFLIRPVLTPAVLTLLGRAASWPSRRVRTESVPVDELRRTGVVGARSGGPEVLQDESLEDEVREEAAREDATREDGARESQPAGSEVGGR
ncbi:MULTISPECIES: MMPL family transporter [unclassified Modestobacter]|uniref:MMPL family transporter n=1 Tax=unclassified Modestobacter TaxID=2643866 RepID=UPI0022AA8D70|nr:MULTISPECIES: MMPL family transporter [unclassified Modestobacter]MCZ2827150.1 MMPL family transporter [Modestobacter sp. VKM Ac-2981]MCZ2854401.1 MMPL family transporter [Modestobacter sp. VKM Ac-2982]